MQKLTSIQSRYCLFIGDKFLGFVCEICHAYQIELGTLSERKSHLCVCVLLFYSLLPQYNQLKFFSNLTQMLDSNKSIQISINANVMEAKD